MHDLKMIKNLNDAAAKRQELSDTTNKVAEDHARTLPLSSFRYLTRRQLEQNPALAEAFRILWMIVNDRETLNAGKISIVDYELALRRNINDAVVMFKEMGVNNAK